jgi:hypothetical protein
MDYDHRTTVNYGKKSVEELKSEIYRGKITKGDRKKLGAFCRIKESTDNGVFFSSKVP